MSWSNWYTNPTDFVRQFQAQIAVACGLCWGFLVVLYPEGIREFSAGMFPPLFMTIWSTDRMAALFHKDPKRLTNFMVKAFGFKLVFYALIFIIILGFSPFEPLKFVLSFLGFFSILHAIEAVYLHQLLKESQHTK